MPFRTASSTIVLTAAAAFALSTSVFAQTMVGAQEVSDDDLPMVTEHCEMLAGDSAGSAMDGAATDAPDADNMATNDMAADDGAAPDGMAGDDAMADTDAGGEMDAGGPDIETGADATTDGAPTTDMPAGEMAGVDYDAITLEECQAAGLAAM
jgi:hypothetical protein